ncbi:D-alanine--D-alanine ligase family protein [Frigoribacterium sp. 2-23]|uniref:D-alanine--D-alanine ligase family protein n=1 Tax=Frigoribacterium sp. 2-23 TaxID=3415006 RepID=UPI003C6F3787
MTAASSPHPTRASRRIAVLGGGANDEHDVSLASAAAVARAVRRLGDTAVPVTIDRDGGWLDADGRPLSPAEAVGLLAGCDVVFPVLHGVDGEDGAIAGLLRLTSMPFVGSPVRAGALAMDKAVTKLLAETVGVRTAGGVLVRPDEEARAVPDRVRRLAGPFIVKPTSGGSSNGVSRVDDPALLPAAIEHAREAGEDVLVESFVVGREVDIALFRDRWGVLRAGATLEIGVPESGFFDRERKYDGTARFTVPARLEAAELASIDRAARALYEALGCDGVARFDFFVTVDGVVLNEVNTSPGFTERSQVPRMYEAVGLDYAGLVGELVAAAAVRAAGRAPARAAGRAAVRAAP